MALFEKKEFLEAKTDFPEKFYNKYFEKLWEIKQTTKEYFYREYGYFPVQNEGCCFLASEKLSDLVNGVIVGGYFTVDRKVKPEELKVPCNFGIMDLCAINRRDSRKLTHWWLEIGNWIIDLTVEQFNRFLKEPLPEILIISKDSPIAKRYEPHWIKQKGKEIIKRYPRKK